MRYYFKNYCVEVNQCDFAPNPRKEYYNLGVMACFHRKYNLGDETPSGVTTPEEFWQRLVMDNISNDAFIQAVNTGKVEGIRFEESRDCRGSKDIYESSCSFPPFGRSDGEERLEYKDVPQKDVLAWLLDDLTIGQCQALLEPYMAWLPLWLYDHSGITMSCGAANPFYCPWDSGQVGWIIAEKKKIMAETCEYVLDENGERIKVEVVHPNGLVTYSWKTRPLTEETWRARAIEYMQEEVQTYDNYLCGEVYEYRTYEYTGSPAEIDISEDPENSDNWEEVDSCCGFFGYDLTENGIIDAVGFGFKEVYENHEYQEVA
jgi:hypothetical protein